MLKFDTKSAAAPNSSGLPGRLLAVGSSSVQGSGLSLRAVDLPMNAFGFFIVSQTQTQATPVVGSAGRICLGGSIGRYVGPGQVQFTGQRTEFALDIDLTAIPQPLGSVAATPGSTWSFQAWFRDSVSGMPSSNFTSGLGVDVQ